MTCKLHRQSPSHTRAGRPIWGKGYGHSCKIINFEDIYTKSVVFHCSVTLYEGRQEGIEIAWKFYMIDSNNQRRTLKMGFK